MKTRNKFVIPMGDARTPNLFNPHWLWNTSAKELKMLMLFYFIEQQSETKSFEIPDYLLAIFMDCSVKQIEKIMRSLRRKNLIKCETRTHTSLSYGKYSTRIITLNKGEMELSLFSALDFKQKGSIIESRDKKNQKFFTIPQGYPIDKLQNIFHDSRMAYQSIYKE